MVLAAACAPAQAPTTQAPAAPTPAAVASPTARPATSPTAAPSAAATPIAATVRLVLAPGSSEARFRVTEQLAGRNLPNDAVGSTKEVTGTIALNGNQVLPGSEVVVQMATLRTDQAQRDGFIHQNTLQSRQFPTAVFALKQIEGLPAQLPTSGQADLKLIGDMTIRGVTKPSTWDAKATFSPQGVTGTATTAIKFADFGMTQPRVPLVLSIEDNIRLELDFNATRAGA
jgi:polyisoprenoid-binding protein YceI